MPNILELREAIAPEGKFPYQDYYINGRRLADRLDVGGSLPPLGWFTPEADIRSRRVLLLDEEFSYDKERLPLFVCNWCGDYLCGYIAASVTRQGNQIIWSDFTNADFNDFDSEGNMQLTYREIEGGSRLRFSFDADQYRAAIEKGIPNP